MQNAPASTDPLHGVHWDATQCIPALKHGSFPGTPCGTSHLISNESGSSSTLQLQHRSNVLQTRIRVQRIERELDDEYSVHAMGAFARKEMRLYRSLESGFNQNSERPRGT